MGEKWNGKAPGQRHHANMTEAAGAYERRVKRYRRETSRGKREDAPGKMKHLNLGNPPVEHPFSTVHFHHTIRKEAQRHLLKMPAMTYFSGEIHHISLESTSKKMSESFLKSTVPMCIPLLNIGTTKSDEETKASRK